MGIWVTPKLSSLPDVAIAAAASGDILKYNGTDWANGDSGNLGPSLYVAASDAAAAEIAKADYVCDGTDDQVQIQAAIDALPASGGRVLLSSGLFVVAGAGTVTGDSLTTPYCVLIDAADGAIQIVGAGMEATTIKLADSQAANTIPLLIRAASTGYRSSPALVSDISFNGNTANQTAWSDFGLVQIAYSHYVTIERCRFYSASFFSLQWFRGSQYLRVSGCRIEPSGARGQLRTEGENAVINGNLFVGTAGATAGNGLDVAVNADAGIGSKYISIQNNIFSGGFGACSLAGASYCSVIGNTFTSQTNNSSVSFALSHYAGGAGYNAVGNTIAGNIFYNVRQALLLSGSATLGCVRNVVSNNVIIDGPDVNLATGIAESGAGSDYNLIANNVIDTAASTELSKVGANTVVRNNTGYNTEASGTAQVDAAATTEDVTHGLAATPTRVQLTPTSDTDGKDFWVSAKGTTTFTISIDSTSASNITFDWRAVVGEE